jgi:hypothetical protein
MYYHLTQPGDMPKKATKDIVEGLCELMIALTVLLAISCGCLSLSNHLSEAQSLLPSTKAAGTAVAPG